MVRAVIGDSPGTRELSDAVPDKVVPEELKKRDPEYLASKDKLIYNLPQRLHWLNVALSQIPRPNEWARRREQQICGQIELDTHHGSWMGGKGVRTSSGP
jgi:hypothetical protein